MDERIKLLARNLINNSVKAEAGDKVYIHHIGQATTGLARQLVKECYKVGALPFVNYTDTSVQRDVLMDCTEDQLKPVSYTHLDVYKRQIHNG